MAYDFGVPDVAFLTSAAGQDAIAALRERELSASSRIADVRAAREVAGERFGAVLETVLLQRKAALKGLDGWLGTDTAMQQATTAEVAGHRARRMAGRIVHDVTCSIGADLAALPTGSFGSDIDPVRLAMARHNCPEKPLLRADATVPVSRNCVVFADPARRDASGRRRWRAADLLPTLEQLRAAYSGRDLVVKCAPGLDFSAVGFADEIEITSLDRQAREACLWVGSVAEAGVRRRATVLSSAAQPWTITDAESDDCPVTAAREWIIDPDPAVVRAGLVRHYAHRNGLAQLDEHIAYLTGDQPPPGIRAFRVLAQLPFAEKALRAELRGRDIGTLEILTRGVAVDPDELRRRLKLTGSARCSVIITRIGRSSVAFVCATPSAQSRKGDTR